MTAEFFSPSLVTWYARHHRALPWRQTRDPYAIWLSEVILQQTRVAQGLPYYERFLAAYPTVAALAAAPPDEVMRHWQGLGYYSRARNMHVTAQLIAHDKDGEFPATYAALVQLRGIGPYTAAAVASLAFGERVAVVDGNVFRVLARIFGLTDDIAKPASRRVFQAKADELLAAAADPATFNQAMMEFGALQCTPAAPDCLFCPFRDGCFAFNHGQVGYLPVKTKAKAATARQLHYLALRWQGQLYLRKRAAGDIWQGLYDLPALETETAELAAADLSAQLHAWQAEPWAPAAALVGEPGLTYRHVLSHQKLAARFHEITLRAPLPAAVLARTGLAPYEAAAVEALPKPQLLVRWLENENAPRSKRRESVEPDSRYGADAGNKNRGQQYGDQGGESNGQI